MTEEKLPSAVVIVGKSRQHLARFSYLAAFVPKFNKESEKDECSTQLLIPKLAKDGKPNPEVQEIKDLIAKLKKEAWTDKKKPVPPQWWNPLRDADVDVKQNGKAYGPETKGHYVLGIKTGDDSDTKKPIIPEVMGTTKDEQGLYVRLKPGEVKSGDYGRVSVRFAAYYKGTGGVGAYFTKLQLVEQGKSLGSGGTSAEEDFSAFDDDEEDDPLK